MPKNNISKYQFTCIVALFLFGSSVLIPPGPAAKQEAWLVLILASFWSVGLFYIYSSLSKLFPGDTIIEYLPKVYGDIIGKLIALIYIASFILLSAEVTRNLVDFLTTLMSETPMFAISIPLLAAGSYLLKKDLDTISKFIEFFFPIVISLYLLATLALIPYMNPYNLLPFFSTDFFTNVTHGFIQASGWPFGEIITLTMIFPFLKNKKEIQSGATQAVIVVGLLFIMVSFRNRTVLGEAISTTTYPSLNAIDMVTIPGLGSIVYLMFIGQISSLFIKVVISYYAATKGIAQLIGSKNYKVFIFPLLIILICLSQSVYDNISDTAHFGLDIYPYYLFLLSFVIPITTYLVAKLRTSL